MALRILVQPDKIQSWIAARNGQPARRRGRDAELAILFDGAHEPYEPIALDELIEAMKCEHRVLLVDEAAGATFHKFVERG